MSTTGCIRSQGVASDPVALSGRMLHLEQQSRASTRTGASSARFQLTPFSMVRTLLSTSLLLWYRDGQDVMARLPLLSTYLGHACVSDTEVYLRITTALLQEANTRFHTFAEDLLPATGDRS